MERDADLVRMQELAGQLLAQLGRLEALAGAGLVEQVDDLEDQIGETLDELLEQAAEQIGYQAEGEARDDEEGTDED